MKTALVLGGGGSRGAYEIGVWKALRELNIKIDIVTGTSIGALNGALIVQDRYQDAYDLWYNIKAEDVTADGIEIEFSMDSFLAQKNKIPRILKKYVHEKGADVTPLKEMIHRLLDYDRFMASPIQYGLVMTRFPSLERLEITKDGMPRDLIEKQIMASASCFPAFPMTEIQGQLYIDGGYCDNVPVDLAVRLGAQRLIVVDLCYEEPTHPHLCQFPNVTFIHPSESLGTILLFNPDIVHKNMQLGYIDTLKAFGALQGFHYTFQPEPKNQPFFMLQLLKSNAAMSLLSRSFDENHFMEIMTEYTRGKPLNGIDFDYRICEIIAELLDLPHEKVYTLQEMQRIFKKHYQNSEYFKYRDIFKQMTNLKKENFIGESRSYLVGCIYHQIRNADNPFEDLTRFSHILTRETLAALYLYLLDMPI